MATISEDVPGTRVVRARYVMRTLVGHVEAGCVMCPHPVLEMFYEDTSEPVDGAGQRKGDSP